MSDKQVVDAPVQSFGDEAIGKDAMFEDLPDTGEQAADVASMCSAIFTIVIAGLHASREERAVAFRDRVLVPEIKIRDVVPDIEIGEGVRHAWRVTLKAVVFASGTTAKIADVTGAVSRKVQITAAKCLKSSSRESVATSD